MGWDRARQLILGIGCLISGLCLEDGARGALRYYQINLRCYPVISNGDWAIMILLVSLRVPL